ncbi:MAG: mandelate racemase/muconate lactonizing enzyme family protein [Motilibacteraceae bacterium]
MKITSIRLHRLELPLAPPFHAAWDPVPRERFPATVVRVETDEGVTGFGSGDSMDGFEPYVGLFLGEDPMRMARHVRALETISFHSGRYWPLEAALWDVVGKSLGVPVAQLFGGALDGVAAYASSGEAKNAQERVETALALRERGFRAMKLRVAQDRVAEGMAAVRAVREALGPEMALMVDLNQAWRMPGDVRPSHDPVVVRRVAEELAELGVLWVEEPLPLTDADGLRRLRDSAAVRVSGGEMVRTYEELLALVEADALDVYQPDVALAGGMLRCRTVAELALAKNRWFTPHTWSNGMGLVANLHVTAGVGGGPWIEFPVDPPGWTEERRDFMLTEPLRIDADGLLRVPAGPGLGVEVDEDALVRFAV